MTMSTREIRFDDVTTPLTPAIEAGLIAFMEAFTATMREAEPNLADCWTSGRALFPEDMSIAGVSFQWGGDGDFDDGLGRFAVLTGGQEP